MSFFYKIGGLVAEVGIRPRGNTVGGNKEKPRSFLVPEISISLVLWIYTRGSYLQALLLY